MSLPVSYSYWFSFSYPIHFNGEFTFFIQAASFYMTGSERKQPVFYIFFSFFILDDSSRVILKCDSKRKGSDYINASTIHVSHP